MKRALPLLLLVATAHAEGEPPAAAPEPKSKIEVDGRVYLRETASDATGEWTSQTSIASARLGADYRRKDLRVRVAVELRKSAKLRSAYVRIEPREGFTVRGGLFKLPLSPLEIESSWDLPMAARGLISNILRDRLQVAGRRVGTEAAWEPGPCPWVLRARAGYFQGLDDQKDGLLGDADDGFGKLGVARLELGPFGASGQFRSGRPTLVSPIRHAWAAAADGTFEWRALRAWIEATAGSSWIVATTTHDTALFLEGRGVAGWRIGGAHKGAGYLEPFVLAGMLDPDLEVARDRIIEVTAGINAGRWKRWRVQAEVEVWRVGANAPIGIAEPALAPRDRTAVVVQLAAAF